MAVNLYVLISGFFLITQKFKLSKLVHIYLEVVFYALLWYIYALTFGLESFSFLTFLFNIICPFSSEQYWFISAYIVMYLLSPLLNFLILKMNKHQHLTACLLLLFLFSFWVDIYPVRNQNIFNLSNGYSFHWFIVLYFIAAYLRLHIDLNKWKHTVIFSIFAYIIISVLSISTNLFNSVFPLVSLWQGHFNRYNSILMVLLSVLVFVTFLKIKISNKIYQRIIAVLSPLTLGVYLIHVNRYGVDFIWHTIIHTERFPDSFLLLPLIILFASLVLFVCFFIDLIRYTIFQIFEKSSFYIYAIHKLDKFINALLEKLSNYLESKI